MVLQSRNLLNIKVCWERQQPSESCKRCIHVSLTAFGLSTSPGIKQFNSQLQLCISNCTLDRPHHVMPDNTHCLQVLDKVAPEANPEAMQEAEPEVADLTTPQNKQKLLYCERFVEFLTDLLSQLPTRRFIRTLLEDRAILTKCRMSALFSHPQGEAFMQPCCSGLQVPASLARTCRPSFVVLRNSRCAE